MKKASDSKYVTEFQKIFFEEPFVEEAANAMAAFEQESFYQKQIQNNLDKKNLFNKAYGDIFYAKKNNKNEIILPNLEFIKSMPFAKNNLSTLSFVADAYSDLLKEWNSFVSRGIITAEQKIDLNPSTAFINFENFYGIHLSRYLPVFFAYISSQNKSNQITNFKTFLKVFSEFASLHSVSNPFTITKFIESKYCPDYVSGLLITTSIKIENLYKDKKTLINSQVFNLYNNLAIKYGFAIDKNNPNNLYFNFYSFASEKYIKKYLKENQTIKKDFYNTFFITSEQYDLYYLQKYIYGMYRTYVDLFPTYSKKIEKKCKTGIIVNNLNTDREVVTQDHVDQILNAKPDYDWWRLFLFIKFCELKLNIDNTIFDKIVENSFQIYETLDMKGAMRYVLRETKTLPRSANSERSFSY